MKVQHWACDGCGHHTLTDKMFNKHRPFCSYCGLRDRMYRYTGNMEAVVEQTSFLGFPTVTSRIDGTKDNTSNTPKSVK